jgi:hypothetical protein
MKKGIYVIVYDRERGKLEFSGAEWLSNEAPIALHREDGPAAEFTDGLKEWWLNGKLHRVDGPAIEADKFKKWYVNGKLHRVDGPAQEYSNGDRRWWIDDQRLYKKDFDQTIQEAKALPLELRLTDPRWWVREMK